MRVGRFAWRLEILDRHGQNQPGAGRHDQPGETVEVGQQRGLPGEHAVELALRPVGRLQGRMPGVHESAGRLLQPIAIERAIRGEMLRKDALVKLRALGQHGVGERDAETAAFVAKQIRQAARLIVLLRRQIRIGDLRDGDDYRGLADRIIQA